MSTFALCVKESSEDKVVIEFRVSGLENSFNEQNYECILLTTEEIKEGATGAKNAQKYVTLYAPEKGNDNHVNWVYNSGIYEAVNRDKQDPREYHREFQEGNSIVIYAYARVEDPESPTSGGYYRIGEPLAFTVKAASCKAEYVSNTSYKIRAWVNYMSVNNTNFAKLGYQINGGDIHPGSAPEISYSSFGVIRNGSDKSYDIDFWVATYDESVEDKDYFWWHICSCTYIRTNKSITNIVVTSVNGGLNVNWASFTGADSYVVTLCNADNSEDVGFEKEIKTTDNDIYIKAKPCTKYKVSVQAYDENGEAISSLTYADEIYITPPPSPSFQGAPIVNKSGIKEIYVSHPTSSEWIEGKKIKLWLKIIDDNGNVVWEYDGGIDLQSYGMLCQKVGLDFSDGMYTILGRTEYIYDGDKGIYCKDECGNDWLMEETIILPREKPNKWSWMMSNGEADWRMTRDSHNALIFEREVSGFDYRVWNDMVANCKEWLEHYGYISETVPGKNVTYEELLEQATMGEEDKVLYAHKFNNLRRCIDKLWNTGIEDKQPLDVVKAEDFTKLGFCLAQA